MLSDENVDHLNYNDTINSHNMSDIEEFLNGTDLNFNRLQQN